MKKKLIVVILAAILLAALFIPIPTGAYEDGGTKAYTSLTYKIVDWNRLTEDGIYQATKLYWFPNNFKSVDDLWANEEQKMVHKFVATILELDSSFALVQPVEGEDELRSSDQFRIALAELEDIGAQAGSLVEIYYTGGIMETYPAKVDVVRWRISRDLRHKQFTEQWLDKETAQKYDHNIFDHIVITEIYQNCFFAETVIPMPYRIKLNGTLSEDWCVGDQVTCTYKNTYYDQENHRVEVDFLTVEASDWQPDPMVAYKPVIYLYPQKERDVSVQLTLNGKLTCTYPAYNTGWSVHAAPDGTLTDANGQTYNYLYWEGQTNARWDLTEGFCVKGGDTARFLEEALAQLGLNRREANEFIVYWLPLMEQNPYNIISFQTDAYTEAAQLQIAPTPDTLIRVFMAWKAADTFTELPKQELTAPERVGFTAIEWGGTEIK